MSNMLRAINADGYSKAKRWCGPAALATLTGAPLVTCTELLSRVSGEKYQKLSGAHNEWMAVAFLELGYRMVPNKEGNARLAAGSWARRDTTLARFVKERTVAERWATLLVQVTGHYVSLHLRYACDNWTMKPVQFTDFPKPRRLVVQSWVVEPLS